MLALATPRPGAPKEQDGGAHEITYATQQGSAAPYIQRRTASESSEALLRSGDVHVGVGDHLVQRAPGDGMVPPGDCGWGKYIALRGAVEASKAIVSALGACSAGDNCLVLAAKMAAISAEIAARVALDYTCFRGGNSGHRQQVQSKVNMLSRCWRFFAASNCPGELLETMEEVTERVREVIEAGATAAVIIAAVIALIVVIIALVEAIIAAGVAAAVAAAAVALIAVLTLLLEQISGADPVVA